VNGPQLLSAYAGHWTGPGTGVTVIVPPPGTVGSGEVRGGAPATREFELLSPVRTVGQVDAVVLSGGSAFGLSAADGVMGALKAAGRGFATRLGPVPIVVGMSIFDGSVAGSPPSAAAGASAYAAAMSGERFASGAVGAGTGATTGKWRSRLDPGGLGVAFGTAGSASVVAVVVVNAWGDVLGVDDTPVFPPSVPAPAPFGNTTVGVLLTDARLSKVDCFLLAQSGHTGYARAIHPAHSRFDGDAVVALSLGSAASVPAAPPGPVDPVFDLDELRAVATETMASAIRSAVSHQA
jgi:L-aminopeptidase/D-esterase-like protein